MRSPDSFDSIDGARFVTGAVLVARYRIVSIIGRGGMGEVYRADDLKLGQPVALKFLPPALSADGAALARFHREVRTARQIAHRNVCRVYDIGETGGEQFITMEYVRGEDLASLLRRIGRLPSDKATEIARQLCAGLAAAHDAGILHRDLKPANVMIDANGNVRIMDFGLAGLAEELRGSRSIEGTPEYMSPEQLEGRELTARSDIYSLGLVLYEIYTGKKAFTADTLTDLIRLRKLETPPASLSSLVKDIDPLVERVILRCLEKDVERRPASSLQVAAALPGGDPLQAALAAGETPSPEMVAAAQTEGGLRPAVAVAMLASVFVLMALVVLLSGKVYLHRQVPLEKSAEGLKERARDIARRLGHTAPPVDDFYGFFHNDDYLRYVREHDQSPARWDKLASGQPTVTFFRYRQSPRYLVPYNSQEVTVDDPPPMVSGMLGMSLDTLGRLTYFYAVPPQLDDSKRELLTPDWSTLFAEAGLDLANFKPVDSRWLPPYPFDARSAWEGVFPEQPQIPIRVEAAAHRGRPVYFEIVVPWDRPTRQEEFQTDTRIKVVQALFIVLAAFILLGGVLLARRNLSLGRGDRKGAFLLAFIVFSLTMLAWVFRGPHVPTFNEFIFFMVDLAWSLLVACLLWLVYIALEPLVRRRWPDRMISWNRLLAGGLHDPLVGRDLLIGALSGLGFLLLNYFRALVPGLIGLPPAAPIAIPLDSLHGIGNLVHMFAAQIISSLVNSSIILFLLLLLSIVLRRERLAIGVVWLLFTLGNALEGTNPPVDWFFAAVSSALILYILIRFGLLAIVFTEFFVLIGVFYPITSDFSVWYAGSSIFALTIGAALAAYGFYISLAGQPLLKDGLLQD